MAQRLQGRTALITGSTSNIGRAIAIAFAQEGAHVVVSGRNEARGAEVVAQIRADGGKADFARADLDGSLAASRALAEEARSLLGGRVDVLVNNAGIYPSPGTLDTDEDTYDRIYDVNVKAPFFLTQALVPGMIDAGGGTIVNLGSWITRLGVHRGSVYSSTKGAMETLTRAWASEFGSRGVRVNAISPGVIASDEWDDEIRGVSNVMMRGTPAGEAGRPDAIARAAVYLASDDAEFVHGIVLDVDGGRTGVAVVAV
ncbi:SDR family oxidoreductase [Lentzea sp. NBRC 102530]|uniref:SDR family NAD(P)-dependent oxidoreductase n=1 Tax=Lentzea sp. NBRC 102530 TaxID=3032201 RepID=UPI0025547262|nr:SDR family oxidoreductase [Lentzea sp. NBRC 102530]